MKKQTAMEWMVEQLPIRIVNMYREEIEKAKQMEKEQMEEFWKGGQDSMEENGKDFEQYYKNYGE